MKNLVAIAILFTASAFATVPTIGVAGGSGTNGSSQLIFNITDSLGVNDIQWANIDIGGSGGGANACIIGWRPGNLFYLFANDGSTMGNGYPQGTNINLSNSQCTLKVATTYSTTSGNVRLLFLDIQFAATFGGTKGIWGVAGGSQGWNGWQFLENWITGPTGGPNPTMTFTNSGGTGTSGLFQFTVTDALGTADIQWSNVDFGGSGGGAAGCVLGLSFSNLWLQNDTATGSDSAPIGSNTTATNSHCTVRRATSSFSDSGTVRTITFDITFSSSFSGTKTVWAVSGGSGGHDGWKSMGSWTVTDSPVYDTLSSYDSDRTVMLDSDVINSQVRKPTTAQPWIVKLKSGRELKIPNAANIRVAKATSNWEPVGDAFVYHLKIDTTDPNLWGFRLGITTDTFGWEFPESLSVPKGWYGSVSAWSTESQESAERAESSEFVFKSKWRPGLLPVFLASEAAKEPAPYTESTDDNERIGYASSIYVNSLQKFIIGPAIKPDINKAELDELIDRWANLYGFKFLEPLTKGENLADLEQPEGGFEQEILACLRAVEAK